MTYVVYLLVTKTKYKWISYVGYTNNIKNRLLAHNNSKGAKFTRGRKWEIIYQKRYKNKSTAMKEEYKLKKDKKRRNILKSNYIKKNENINFTAL